VIALFAFGLWYSRTVVDLNNAAEIAAKGRAEKFKNAEKVLADKLKLAPKPTIAVVSPPPSTRKTAPYADRIGPWGVSVLAAEILADKSGNGDRLKLTLRISNHSDFAAVHPDWSRPGSHVRLFDQFGNLFNQIYNPHDAKKVDAGNSTDESLLFNAPPLPGMMELDLGIADSERPFEFKLASGFIKRNPPRIVAFSPPRIQTLAPPSPAPPPPPVPYDPENDPVLCAEIIDAYKEGISSMNRRILGMSFDRGTQFRRLEPERLRKALAKKYKLEEAQIKRILRGL
jgi:hypothetical protein